jgi:hypothetical protein
MTADPRIDQWMRVLASLDVPSALEPPSTPLPAAEWTRMLSGARSRRLVGALAWAIEDGRWPAHPPQRDEALAAHRAVVARDLVLERHLVEHVRLLGRHDIPALALKGPVLAHLVYPRASSRSFRDIDLLVPGHLLPRAIAALEATGARRHFPEPRPGFDARFTKGAALTTASGHEVDLHRTLAAGAYGLLIDPATIHATARTIEIGGEPVGVPDLASLTVHACIHAVLGEAWPQPEIMRDVAVTTHHPDADLASTLRLAGAWQAETVVAFAFGATWTDLALDREHPAARWASTYRPTRRDLRRLDPYLLDHRDHARQSLAATWELPRWRDRARYLRAVALPDAAVHRHRDRWSRGLAGLRHRVPAP